MNFPSKVDGWLIPALLVAFAGMLAAILGVMIVPTPWPVRALTVVVIVLVIFLTFAVFRNTSYTVGDTELLVVSGPFRWKVPLSEITDVTPTRNPLSSPALSLDRLKVSYGKRKFILVSPANKRGFVDALERARRAQE